MSEGVSSFLKNTETHTFSFSVPAQFHCEQIGLNSNKQAKFPTAASRQMKGGVKGDLVAECWLAWDDGRLRALA